MARLLSILVCTVIAATVSANQDKVIICVYDNDKFDIGIFNSSLCTHAIYSFIGISQDGNLHILNESNNANADTLKRFNDMKKQNPNLKNLLSTSMDVDGESTANFSKVAWNPELLQIFADNVVTFLTDHEFDGFEVYWEYPLRGSLNDINNLDLVSIFKTIRDTFDKANKNFILMGSVVDSNDVAEDIPKFSEYLDFIHMVYYHNISWANDSNRVSVDEMVQNWFDRGIPPQKIIMELGGGKLFTFDNVSHEEEMLEYNKICLIQQQGDWTLELDDRQKMAYMSKDNVGIVFDNEKSLGLQADLINSKNLSGAIFWSINGDDYLGTCGKKYPCLTALNNLLRGSYNNN